MMPALWFLREMPSLPAEVQPADQLLHQDCAEAQGVEIYLQEDVENIRIPWVECTPLDHPWISRASKTTDVFPCPRCSKPNLAWTCGLCQNNVLGQQLLLLSQLCSPDLQFSSSSCSQNNTKKKFQKQLQVSNQPSSSPCPLPVWALRDTEICWVSDQELAKTSLERHHHHPEAVQEE